MKSVVKFEMSVPVRVKNDGNLFIAVCSALDVTSQGSNKEQAVGNLIEALQLFVETCYEMGTLEKVLREQGFHPGESIEDDSEDAPDWVHVPLLLVAADNAKACAA